MGGTTSPVEAREGLPCCLWGACAPGLLLGGPSSHPPGVGSETRHPHSPGPAAHAAQRETMCGVDRDATLPDAGPGAPCCPQPGTEVAAWDALSPPRLGDGQWVLAIIFFNLKSYYLPKKPAISMRLHNISSFPLPRCPLVNYEILLSSPILGLNSPSFCFFFRKYFC